LIFSDLPELPDIEDSNPCTSKPTCPKMGTVPFSFNYFKY
jgi:hypothetical protein